MRDHFQYLIDEDAEAFFRKMAVDESGVRATQSPPPPLTKTAAVAQTPFEKVAARLDRDLDYLQLAGPCGSDGGMMKRANAYIDVLTTQADLADSELEHIFDKVAAYAIEIDLKAAYDEFCAELPEDEHVFVDDVLVKAAHDLTKLAILEKEAFRSLLRAAANVGSRAGSAVARTGARAGGAIARGSSRAARAAGEFAGGGSTLSKVRSGVAGATRAVGTAARDVAGKAAKPFRTTADGFRTARTARIAKTRGELATNLASARAASSAPGLRGQVAQGAAANLEKQVAGNRSSALAQASREASKTKAKMGLPPTAKASTAKTKAPDVETASGPAKPAGDASKPPKDPPKAKAEAAKEPEGGGSAPKADDGPDMPAPPGGAAGKPPGFMDAWKKVTTSGWSALSPGERGSLIRGGVTAAIAYRAVSGNGAITGGDGLV